MGKKLQKYLDEAEKTEQQIAELEERLRTIRAAQKKEEDSEIIACVQMEHRTLAVFCMRRHTVQHGPWATTKLLPTFWTRRMAAP